MPTEEYRQLQEALRQAKTPEERKAAAEAMRKYLEKRKEQGQGSKPTLVSLGFRKTYPHAVPLDEIPDEMERNPEFFNLVKRVVTKEKT